MADEPLLIGVPDENMGQNDDRICSWGINKIGGVPNWMYGEPSHFPRCPVCNSQLLLVFQVYCPLTGSPYHRVLYLFGCTRPSCWHLSQSWKVLRCQAKDTSDVSEERTERKASCQVEVDEWCNDAGDWGDEEFATSDASMAELEQHTGKMSVHGNAEPSKSKETTGASKLNSTAHKSSISAVPHFVPYYVSVIDEPSKGLSAPKTLKHEQKLIAQYQQREGAKLGELMESDDSTNSWSGEKYEKASLKHGDKAFHKFYKTVQLCAEQVLRYQRGGVPLSLTTTTPNEIQTRVPPCQFCGSRRLFEVQLMPALVNILRTGGDNTDASITQTQRISQEHEMKCAGNAVNNFEVKNSPRETAQCSSEQHSSELSATAEDVLGDCDKRESVEGFSSSLSMTIEFGTVLVYTCSNSCWLDSIDRDSFREEYVIVEADPDARLFMQGSRKD